MDPNTGKPPLGPDSQVHYPQLQQENYQSASAPPPPPYATTVQPPVQQTGESRNTRGLYGGSTYRNSWVIRPGPYILAYKGRWKKSCEKLPNSAIRTRSYNLGTRVT